MIMLALDASTTAVGWALFDGGQYQRSGVFVPVGDDWKARIGIIADWLNHTFFGLDVVAYEIASGAHRNMATNRKLGAVEWACWSVVCRKWAGVKWITVQPIQVKRSGCHKGALPHARAIVEAAGYALDEKNPGDEADAIGVGLAALKKMGWRAIVK